jgi:hypothetical protein
MPQDERGSLARAEASEGASERVSLGDRLLEAVTGRQAGRQLADLPLLLYRSSRVDAGVNEDSAEPGIEASGFAQPRQRPPGPHERLLHGILTERRVVEHEGGGGVQPLHSRPEQRLEGARVAGLCPLDQLNTHSMAPCTKWRVERPFRSFGCPPVHTPTIREGGWPTRAKGLWPSTSSWSASDGPE